MVFASSANAATIFALTDTDNTGTRNICTLYVGPGGAITNGIDYDPATDTLYAGEMSRIIKIEKAGAAALNNCQPGPLQGIKLYDIPPPANTDGGHGRRSVAISPNGTLYFSIATPGNVGNCIPPICTVQQLDVKTEGAVPITAASGLRNPAGLAIDPRTGHAWSAMMARDNLWAGERDGNGTSISDNAPDDLVVHISQPGQNYQFPYCHWKGDGDPLQRAPGSGYTIVDDGFTPPGQQPPAGAKTLESWNSTFAPYCTANATKPAQSLGPHVTPIGLKFYQTKSSSSAAKKQNWPKEWSGTDALYVAEHGSWNRNNAIGYRVAFLRVTPDGQVKEHKVFASGFLQGDTKGEQFYWGRPVDVLTLPDGSLLISDDDSGAGGGAIYRVSYDPNNKNVGTSTAVTSGGLVATYFVSFVIALVSVGTLMW